MLATPAIRNLVREARVAQLYSAIQTGAQFGMQTLDQALKDLVARGLVGREEARALARDADSL
jgi:twitching motility protein PilT